MVVSVPTEEYVMNRLFNDELFPEQRDAPAIEETPVSWGDDEAVATVGRAFALLPGLSLLAREDDAGAIVSTAALGAAATPAERVNNDPARTWDMDPGAAAAAVDAAARLAGQSESVRASYIEQIVDASPRLHASSAAAGVATPTATTTPRLHAEGITPKLVDAESAGRRTNSARGIRRDPRGTLSSRTWASPDGDFKSPPTPISSSHATRRKTRPSRTRRDDGRWKILFTL